MHASLAHATCTCICTCSRHWAGELGIDRLAGSLQPEMITALAGVSMELQMHVHLRGATVARREGAPRPGDLYGEPCAERLFGRIDHRGRVAQEQSQRPDGQLRGGG